MSTLRKNMPTIVAVLITAAITWTGPSVAHGIRHALFAHNADKVDGKHAVGARVPTSRAKGKLVATGSNGKFGGRFIPRPACPRGTRLHEAACIETSIRPANATGGNASYACREDGRRLPTPAELLTLAHEMELGRGDAELTLGNYIEIDGSNTHRYWWVVVSEGSGQAFVGDTAAYPYRCVAALY